MGNTYFMRARYWSPSGSSHPAEQDPASSEQLEDRIRKMTERLEKGVNG
jgi:hypothetical protein